MKKRRDLKMLWSSNAPHTNSGYATQTRDVLYRLLKDRWQVACNGFWGGEGYPMHLESRPAHGELFKKEWEGLRLKVYPKMGEPFGADSMFYHGQDFKANAIVSMQDLGPLNPEFLSKIKVWIPWVPIDKDPVPPVVLDRLRYAYKIITFSKFGQKELEKKGYTSTLILEGVDTEIFKPKDKLQVRKELGLPENAFIFGMVAANKENPPRKGFQEALEAFKLFYDKHPEAIIMFHTQQQAPGNFPIKGFTDYLGITKQTFFMSDYHSIYLSDSETIAKEMNAFDVLLHPSQTEGFGLTVIEAGACGIPVVVNDCTSMPEMVVDGVTGAISKAGKPRWASDNAWVYPADVNSLYEKMEEVYTLLSKNPAKVVKDCRDHVVKNYNIETTAKQWIELLEELQDELMPEKQLTNTEKSSTIMQAK